MSRTLATLAWSLFVFLTASAAEAQEHGGSNEEHFHRNEGVMANPLGALEGVEPLLAKYAPPDVLEEFRLPMVDDIQGDWAWCLEEWVDSSAWRSQCRASDPDHLPIVARGDLNGDGLGDLAVLMLSRTTESDGLFCLMSDGAGAFEFHVLSKKVHGAENHGIGIVPPGTYETPAEQAAGGRPAVTLEHETISFWKFEISSSYFVWDAKSRSFTRVWISGI